jgi:hypothetical protein
MQGKPFWIRLALSLALLDARARAEAEPAPVARPEARRTVKVVTFLDAGSDSIEVLPQEMTEMLLGEILRDPGFEVSVEPREPEEASDAAGAPDVLATGFYRLKGGSIHLDVILTLRTGHALSRQFSEAELEPIARGLHLLVRSAFCRVAIRSVPPGARVRLDDAELEQATPLVLEDVLRGKHSLSLQLDGHEPLQRIVDIEEDSELEFPLAPEQAPTPGAEPARKPEAYGYVKFRKMPWAKVYVDGHLLGDTASLRRIRLEVGEHEIRMVSPEAGTKTFRIQVRENETYAANF